MWNYIFLLCGCCNTTSVSPVCLPYDDSFVPCLSVYLSNVFTRKKEDAAGKSNWLYVQVPSFTVFLFLFSYIIPVFFFLHITTLRWLHTEIVVLKHIWKEEVSLPVWRATVREIFKVILMPWNIKYVLKSFFINYYWWNSKREFDQKRKDHLYPHHPAKTK